MPPEPSILPTVNASLNATAALLLLIGFVLIRAGNRRAHAAVMISAFAVSAVFLVCYLTYHYTQPMTLFPGTGLIRRVYFAILVSHVILAVLVPPLAVTALWFAALRRFDRHRRVARYLYPLWMYVSVTGVIVYWMLYRLD